MFPTDLLSISDLIPAELTESALSQIVYTKWYSVKNHRLGSIIAVSNANIGNSIASELSLPAIEDMGFLKDIEIELIQDVNKKWHNLDGFYV